MVHRHEGLCHYSRDNDYPIGRERGAAQRQVQLQWYRHEQQVGIATYHRKR